MLIAACWTLRFTSHHMIIIKVEAEFLIKTDVFIHHQGQFFSPDSRFMIWSLVLLIHCIVMFIWSLEFLIHQPLMQFCLTFRARVDVAPKNYVKIAVNHEVSLSITYYYSLRTSLFWTTQPPRLWASWQAKAVVPLVMVLNTKAPLTPASTQSCNKSWSHPPTQLLI